MKMIFKLITSLLLLISIQSYGSGALTLTYTTLHKPCAVGTYYAHNYALVTLSATGGTAPYQYKVNSGGSYQTSDSFNYLYPGIDTFYVKDATGTVQSDVDTIVATTPITITATVTNAYANLWNGSIVTSVSGGTGPYSYVWSNTTGYPTSQNNLAPGQYTLTIIDNNLCDGFDTFNIINGYGPLSATASVVNEPWCIPSGNGGRITINPIYGDPPYQYSINGGSYQSNNVFYNLAAGSYTISVKDAEDSMYQFSAAITHPSGWNVTSQSINSSPNLNNGGITINVSGGIAPYIYTMNGISQLGNTFGYLAPGSYQVSVTDSVGICDTTLAFTIDTTSVGPSGPNQTTCRGGQATLNGSGTGGQWITLQTNPQYTTISDVYIPTVTVGLLNTPGLYGYIYAPYYGDTAWVTVIDLPDAGPSQTVTCAHLPGGSATMAAYGAGIWSAMPGNPGTATITNPTNPATTITGFSIEGVYVFAWTNAGGCVDTATVTVTGTFTTTLSQVGGCLGQNILKLTNASEGSIINWYLNGSLVDTTVVTPRLPDTLQVVATAIGIDSPRYIDPVGLYVDGAGYLYVADYSENRIVKYPPGSTTTTVGVIVAGGNGPGSAPNQLNGPYAVFVDDHGYIYVADQGNDRIQKFPPNSTSATDGVTVAAGSSAGFSGYRFYHPYGVSVDSAGQIYVLDSYNSRVLRFPPGSDSTTMGLNVAGSGAYTGSPDLAGLYVDNARNVYISDQTNQSVYKFPAYVDSTSAQSGMVIAGGNGVGSGANQFWDPEAIAVDAAGYLYVADYNEGHVQRFPPGSGPATNAVTVATLNLFGLPVGLALDREGNIYLGDVHNQFVVKWNVELDTSYIIPNAPGVYTAQYTSNGCVAAVSNPVTIDSCPAAGPDQTICQRSTATMAASGRGTWSALSSNPAATAFSNDTSTTSTISGFTVAGTYKFVWAQSNGRDTMKVTVTANTLMLTDSVTDIHCFGDSGSICVNVSGGTPGYSYNWSINTTSSCQSGLGAGVYYITVSDVEHCMIIDTAVITGPVASLSVSADSVSYTTCGGGNDGSIYLAVTGGTPSYSYTWSLPDTSTRSSSTGLMPDIYCVTVTDHSGCTATICATVLSQICGTDSVWPGDADNNGIVDIYDLLPIGLGYDSTGPARMVQNIIWQPDSAEAWRDTFTYYLPNMNFKYADCNGDGIINADDTLALVQNYSLIHAKNGGQSGSWRSAVPALYAIASPDTLHGGDTLTVNFILGTASVPVANFYGLAFTYNFDPLLVDPAFTEMHFDSSSWIGTSSDKISIVNINSSGQIKAAVTRIDHTTRSGNGIIATAKFRISSQSTTTGIYPNPGVISEVTAIDQHGILIPLNAGADTTFVKTVVNGIQEITNETLHIQPNPAHDKVLISAGNIIRVLSITDVMGQQVMKDASLNAMSKNVDISAYDSGIYIIEVETDRGLGIAKLVIDR